MNELDLLEYFRVATRDPSSDAWVKARAAISAARAEVDDGPVSKRSLRVGRTQPRRRRLVVPVGAATAAIAFVLMAALLLKHGDAAGPSSELAGWTASPSTPTSAQLKAAEAGGP